MNGFRARVGLEVRQGSLCPVEGFKWAGRSLVLASTHALFQGLGTWPWPPQHLPPPPRSWGASEKDTGQGTGDDICGGM